MTYMKFHNYEQHNFESTESAWTEKKSSTSLYLSLLINNSEEISLNLSIVCFVVVKFSVVKFPQKALSFFFSLFHFIYTSARIIFSQSRFSTQPLNILNINSQQIFLRWIIYFLLYNFFFVHKLVNKKYVNIF